MSATENKIKELLGNGLTNDVVATAVGVHPSYVSQLMAVETFANEVAELRTKTLLSTTSRDRSYDALEDKLLTRLGDLVDSGMVYKHNDLLRTLALVNKAVRRGNPATEAFSANKVVVELSLPKVVVNKFKRNSLGEVVEVTTESGAQTLVTMPAMQLMSQLLKKAGAAQTTEQASSYEQVRRLLPPSDEKQI